MFKFLDTKLKTNIDFKQAKYCYHCGKELHVGKDKKCLYCGALEKDDSIAYINDDFGVITYFEKNTNKELKSKVEGKTLNFLYEKAEDFFKSVLFNYVMSIAVVIGATTSVVGVTSYVVNEVYINEKIEKPYVGDKYIVGIENQKQDINIDINEDITKVDDNQEVKEDDHEEIIENNEQNQDHHIETNDFFGRYSDFLTLNGSSEGIFANGDIGGGAYYDYAKSVGAEGLGKDNNTTTVISEGDKVIIYVCHGGSNVSFAKLTLINSGGSLLLVSDEAVAINIEELAYE